MLNVYLQHEYEIYKNYAPEPIFVLAHTEIQIYIYIMISGASRYFGEFIHLLGSRKFMFFMSWVS